MANTANPASDTLKELVAERLESNGALDQIRTQIRAHLFKALLSQDSSGGPASTEDGATTRSAPLQMVSVVADFLRLAELDQTQEVFLRESKERPIERDELARGLEGSVGAADEKSPVLEQVVAVAKRKAQNPPTIDEESDAPEQESNSVLMSSSDKFLSPLKGRSSD